MTPPNAHQPKAAQRRPGMLRTDGRSMEIATNAQHDEKDLHGERGEHAGQHRRPANASLVESRIQCISQGGCSIHGHNPNDDIPGLWLGLRLQRSP